MSGEFTIVEALVLALVTSGLITAVVTWLSTKRNKKADRQQVEVQTYLLLIQPLEEQIQALRTEVADLKRETELCHAERDADRNRIKTLELEVAHYKGGPTAHYHTHYDGNPSTTSEEGDPS